VSTIWLRVGEVEQEERVSVWSRVTSKSRLYLTLKQRSDCSDYVLRRTTFSHRNTRCNFLSLVYFMKAAMRTKREHALLPTEEHCVVKFRESRQKSLG